MKNVKLWGRIDIISVTKSVDGIGWPWIEEYTDSMNDEKDWDSEVYRGLFRLNGNNNGPN